MSKTGGGGASRNKDKNYGYTRAYAGRVTRRLKDLISEKWRNGSVFRFADVRDTIVPQLQTEFPDISGRVPAICRHGVQANLPKKTCGFLLRTAPGEYRLAVVEAKVEVASALNADASDETLIGFVNFGTAQEQSDALQLLVDRNMPIIRKLARKNTTLDPEWAETRGIEGLWKAAKKFDPTKGVKFSTYAYSWIFRETRTRTKADRALPTDKPAFSGSDDGVTLLDIAATTDATIGQTDFYRDLTSAMASVADEAKKIFFRKAERNESYRQIAEDLGWSVAKVRQAYSDACEQLQASMAGYSI